MRVRFLSTAACAGLCGVAMAGTVFAGALPVNAAVSPSLLKNGTAEAGAGGTGNVVSIPGWTRSTGTTATVVKYGTRGFPSTSSPSPHTPGKNFFAGGPEDTSFPDQVLLQKISLSKYAAKIKGGKVTFTAAGWFGGNGSSNDQALVEVDFADGSGGQIGTSTQVGSVTAANRNNVTGLLHRIVTAKVPAGAKFVLVQLILENFDGGYNNGYADNVTLTLAGV